MKTNELIGPALDWAVASLEKLSADDLILVDGVPVIERTVLGHTDFLRCEFSKSWCQAGPIIEREIKTLERDGAGWFARSNSGYTATGPTALTAAMRCYVASRLGEEIELPEGLQ